MKKFTLLIITCLLLNACYSVGGSCTYEAINGTLQVTAINSNTITFNFTPGDYEMDVPKKKYPQLTFSKGQQFTATIKKMRRGSCTPLIITKIE